MLEEAERWAGSQTGRLLQALLKIWRRADMITECLEKLPWAQEENALRES